MLILTMIFFSSRFHLKSFMSSKLLKALLRFNLSKFMTLAVSLLKISSFSQSAPTAL